MAFSPIVARLRPLLLPFAVRRISGGVRMVLFGSESSAPSRHCDEEGSDQDDRENAENQNVEHGLFNHSRSADWFGKELTATS
jgi:hypothetical protein